jgi:hypothetical protein
MPAAVRAAWACNERMESMDLLKQLMTTILEKYHLDPAEFSGKLSFEIEVKDGKASILNHSLVSDAVTLH